MAQQTKRDPMSDIIPTSMSWMAAEGAQGGGATGGVNTTTPSLSGPQHLTHSHFNGSSYPNDFNSACVSWNFAQ